MSIICKVCVECDIDIDKEELGVSIIQDEDDWCLVCWHRNYRIITYRDTVGIVRKKFQPKLRRFFA